MPIYSKICIQNNRNLNETKVIFIGFRMQDFVHKVEKILKSSLGLILSPLPSVKNSNYGRKSLLEV